MTIPTPLRWPGKELPVYCQPELHDLRPFSPLLLVLSLNDPIRLGKELGYLLHHCNARPMLSLLQTCHTAEEIQAQWQDALVATTRDEKPFFLRCVIAEEEER